MKTSTVRTGLTIAALALAGCAADELTTGQGLAAASEAATTSTVSSDEQPCNGDPSQVLFLKDADGQSFKLIHVRGCGWKRVDNLAQRKTSLSPVGAAHAATMGALDGDPLTVFIDGPTGYTFVWTDASGWKFVGYLSGGAR
jgi:hypothetical protein